MVDQTIIKDEALGLYRCDMTVVLPPITVTKWKKSRDDFRYEMQRAVNEELGVEYEYEPTRIPYEIQFNYTPDFVLPNGIYLECKGLWEPDDRRKIKAVIEQHPEIDLRMVFQAPFNKISKKSKTTYAKWCDKHNIKWCSFGNIPIEWLI